MSIIKTPLGSTRMLRLIRENPKAHDMYVEMAERWAVYLDGVERAEQHAEPEPPYTLALTMNLLTASHAGRPI